MKIQRLFFTAAFAALAFAHVASAQINIYLSGAPATRKIWNTAIADTLATYTSGVVTTSTYYTGSSFASANQIAILGANISGTAVNIYASWDGSTSGNQSVANTPPATIPAFQVAYINTSSLSPGSVSSSSTTTLAYPEINLSDTKQNTTPFNGTTNVTTPTTSYVQLTEATPKSPAVTGFQFVANKNAPLTNITTDLAQELFTSYIGVPLAQFDAVASDTGTVIYPVGRDIGSGSRYILDAETGIGTANDDSLVQFTPAYSSGTLSNILGNPSASGTINEIAYNQYNGGYPSTTAIEAALENTSIPSIGYIVGYLTDSDAAQVSANTVALTWNGVPYSVGNIQQGLYTYWSFLHVYYNSSYLSTYSPIAVTFANYLAQDIATDTNTGAILSSSLKVSRNNDGAIVTGTYNYP